MKSDRGTHLVANPEGKDYLVEDTPRIYEADTRAWECYWYFRGVRDCVLTAMALAAVYLCTRML